jgi:hypothetical protein
MTITMLLRNTLEAARQLHDAGRTVATAGQAV